MNKRFPSIVGLLAALLLVISFVLPINMVSPTGVKADPGILEWTIVDTPDSLPGATVRELFTPSVANGYDMGSEIIKLLIAPDGNTMWAIVARGDRHGLNTAASGGPNPYVGIGSQIQFFKSTNGGRAWSGAAYGNLNSNMSETANYAIVWDMAIAPDDANIAMVAVSRTDTNTTAITQEVWITVDGGSNWDNTQWRVAITGGLAGTDWISAMDISIDYGGARKVLVATRGPANTAMPAPIAVMKIPGFGGWNAQSSAGSPVSPNNFTGQILAAKFSPTFGGDSTIVVLYVGQEAGVAGTYLVSGAHDIASNITNWYINGSPVPIKNSDKDITWSPTINDIISGVIALPSDYSGQSASLRRVYVGTDVNPGTPPIRNAGVYRVDDTVIYTLMDNTATFGLVGSTSTVRRVASIAYWGTYASGKLLVGERLGYACQAAVPVWFTDSPTVCPIPCWYPSKKPPTGAAGYAQCQTNSHGYGNAYVVWSPKYADQGVAYAVTASSSIDAAYVTAPIAAVDSAFGLVETDLAQVGNNAGTTQWPIALFNIRSYDESAMSLTRNNGETFNQMALIDTLMTKLTDVAVSPDCSTVYLVSINTSDNLTRRCAGFDSVWRSTSNAAVVDPPLPALPIGQVWERVRASQTAAVCDTDNTTNGQSEYAIVRIAPDKLDGQIVFWAAGGANGAVIGGLVTGANKQAAAWSPDYGDFWSNISPRIPVQDMAAESSTVLYIVNAAGSVQKMPYTGTAWSSTVSTVNTYLGGAHTIEAMAEGKVLVGASTNQNFAAAYSTNGGTSYSSWSRTPLSNGNFHAIFDPDFATNKLVYIGDDQTNQSANPNAATIVASTGHLFRNDTDGLTAEWIDMYTSGYFWSTVTAATAPHGFYGLVATNSKNITAQPTLYAATAATPGLSQPFSSVMRTLTPRAGIPKPALSWDQLIASASFYQTFGVLFTLEPKSLKFCGCLTDATDTTLYAIDNDFYAGNHNVKHQSPASAPGPSTGVGSVVALGPGLGTWPPVEITALIPWSIRETGMLWAYTDCVAKRGPKLTMDDGTIIGCDPASGRNMEVNFTWEQLCVANMYQLQVAKDTKFTLNVADVTLTPVSVTSPAFIYWTNGGAGTIPSAGGGSITVAGNQIYSLEPLECGHRYYWKVRVRGAVTGELIRSPWSDVRSFTIKAGFRVTTPYYGVQLLTPVNASAIGCDAPMNFSWSPFNDAQKYKFELSENPDMTSPVVSIEVSTTAYQYKGTMKCNTAYYWRVMATQPAPSDWSAVFTVSTMKAPVAPTPTPVPEEKTPIWVWVLIAIGAILVIVTLVLIFKTRRV